MCIACRNAGQIRISGNFHLLAFPRAPCRIVRNATQFAFPANSLASAPARGPIAADRWSAPPGACAVPGAALLPATCDRCPDIPVDGIWPHPLPSTCDVFCSGARCLASPSRVGGIKSRNAQGSITQLPNRLVVRCAACCLAPRLTLPYYRIRRNPDKCNPRPDTGF